MVADISTDATYPNSTPAWLTEVDGALFFCAWNPTYGREPFKLDVSKPLHILASSASGSTTTCRRKAGINGWNA